MKLQEDAVNALEAEAKLVLKWKAEHQRRLKERTFRQAVSLLSARQ
jgi:hypothetical protein